MAKARTIQNVLNGGELAPRLKGRLDIPRAKNGLELCRNAVPTVMGGAGRTPGTRYMGAAGNSTVLLAGVVLSASERYVLEFSDSKLRFWKNRSLLMSGGNPYSIVTPYPAAHLAELTVEQTVDEIYLFHRLYPTRKLTRSGDIWTIAVAPFKGGPFIKASSSAQTATLTPSADSGNITITSSIDLFDPADVGGLLRLDYPMDTWGYVEITGYTDAKTVDATVIRPLGENYVDNPAFNDSMVGWDDTSTGVAHSEYDTVNKQVSLIASEAGGKARIEYEVQITPARSYTISVNVKQAPVSVKVGRADSKAVYHSHLVTDAGVYTGTLSLDILQPGRVYIVLETDYGTEETIGIIDDVTLKGSTQLQTKKYQFGAWSPKNGYPHTGVFHEQRLVVAGSEAAPTSIWGSRIDEKPGDLEDFTLGTADNDAFGFIPAALTTRINHLVAADSLFAFGFNRIVTLSGGDATITPTNVSIKKRGKYSVNQVIRPQQIGNQFYFLSGTGKKLRNLKYSLEESVYNAPDISLYSEHFVNEGGGIAWAVYLQEPDGVLWCGTADGSLLSCTLDNDQQVIAWAKHPRTGLYISGATIPNELGEDELWLAAQRFVDGAWQTTIEIMEPGLNTEAAVTGTDDAGKATWDGLDHLEGLEVDIVADGFVHRRLTVANGAVTLDREAYSVEIGLPYQTVIKDLPLEIGSDGSTIQGANVQVANVRVRLYETKGATINGERLAFQQFGADLLDTPVAAFSGDKTVDMLGRGTEPEDSQVEIIQDLPLPLTVLAIIKEVSVNG